MDNLYFKKFRPGEAIFYEADQIEKVLTYIGGSRDPDAPILFQIVNVNSGEINLKNKQRLESSTSYD